MSSALNPCFPEINSFLGSSFMSLFTHPFIQWIPCPHLILGTIMGMTAGLVPPSWRSGSRGDRQERSKQAHKWFNYYLWHCASVATGVVVENGGGSADDHSRWWLRRPLWGGRDREAKVGRTSGQGTSLGKDLRQEENQRSSSVGPLERKLLGIG